MSKGGRGIKIEDSNLPMENTKKLILRSIREGAIQLWRNKFLSITTILLGALILFLINFVFAVQYFADYSLEKLESRADFTVPLRPDYDSFLLEALENELTEYNLAVNVYEAQKLEDFEVPTRLHLKFGDLEEVRDIFGVLKKTRYDPVVDTWDIDSEREFTNLILKLVLVRNTVEKASFWLSLIFLVGGIFLVINTFRIALFSRKEEIFIARFIGAEQKFIMGPFLVEGLLLGLMASIIAIFSFIFVLKKIEALPGGDIFLHLWNNIFSNEILISAVIGMLGAWIAVSRYLTGRFEQ